MSSWNFVLENKFYNLKTRSLQELSDNVNLEETKQKPYGWDIKSKT